MKRRVVLGPVQKGPDRLALEVLRTPRVQRTLDELATRSRRARPLVEADALKELLRLGARPDPWVIGLLDRAFSRDSGDAARFRLRKQQNVELTGA